MTFCEYHGLNTGILLHSDKDSTVKELCRCCGRLIDQIWIDGAGDCADCHFNCERDDKNLEEDDVDECICVEDDIALNCPSCF